MSTRFTRPAGTYDSTSVTTNMTKYRTDSAAVPKVAISSAKVDGDFNTIIDALNALDDDITGLIAGTVPDGSITAPKLASNAVTTAKILDANVTTAKIAPLAVDATLLASNAVTTAKILDANVTETKLANAAVTANKIGSEAVNDAKIAPNAVTTVKILDDAVTFAKIQNVNTSTILGRATASSGDVESLSTRGMNFSGTTVNPKVLRIHPIAYKTDTEVISTSTYTDIANLTTTITPLSTNSKFVVCASISAGSANTNVFAGVKFIRVIGGTPTDLQVAPTAGSRVRTTFDIGGSAGSDAIRTSAFTVQDAPATTSAVTYKCAVAVRPSFSIWINRTSSDTDSTNFARYVSSIYVIEYED